MPRTPPIVKPVAPPKRPETPPPPVEEKVEIELPVLCAQCGKVALQPTAADCGHHFCRPCLWERSGAQKMTDCPQCGIVISTGGFLAQPAQAAPTARERKKKRKPFGKVTMPKAALLVKNLVKLYKMAQAMPGTDFPLAMAQVKPTEKGPCHL